MFDIDYPVPIFYDLETTGLDVENDCIVQIAAKVSPRWLQQQGLDALVFEERLVKPSCPISNGAFVVHHISEDMVSDAPSFTVMFREFSDFCERAAKLCKSGKVMLIAHNNFKFDRLIMDSQCFRNNLSCMSFVSHADTYDVFVSKFAMPRYHASLARLAVRLKCDNLVQTHNAESDVDLLIEVVEKCGNILFMYRQLFNGLRT
jgi:DNA polymerase III epsilon subunit-like protein